MPDIANDGLTCIWCRAPMTLEVHVAPVGSSEGMSVYRCAECDRVDTVFLAPKLRRQDPIRYAASAAIAPRGMACFDALGRFETGTGLVCASGTKVQYGTFLS